MAQQTCNTCEKSQPEGNFQKNRWGRVGVCKSCRKPRAKKKLDPNSAGYTEATIGAGKLFDGKSFRIEMKGVGKTHINKINSRSYEARQCTYYPNMKPAPKYTPEELKKMNPFDEGYDGYWAEGTGRTEQAAIRSMREDIKLMRKGEA